MKGNEYNKRFEKIDKLLYVLIVLVSISLLIGIINMSSGSSNTTDNNTTEEETSGEYDVSMFDSVDIVGLKEAIDNPLGPTVVYIGRASCGYCVQFLPVMQQAQDEYGFTTVYYDITQVIDFTSGAISNQDDYDYIVGLDTFFKDEFGSTPMVAVFEDGKYVNGHVGYTDYETYAKFLEDSGITKK